MFTLIFDLRCLSSILAVFAFPFVGATSAFRTNPFDESMLAPGALPIWKKVVSILLLPTNVEITLFIYLFYVLRAIQSYLAW